jgi:hypothetical protein
MNKKDNIWTIIGLAIAVLPFIILFIFYHIDAKTYFFIYPKLTTVLTYIVLVISSIVLSFLLLNYYKKIKDLEKVFRKQLVYIIFIVITISFVFGSLQYLLYISDHTSFIIDDEILQREVIKEQNQIIKIQNKYLSEKYVCVQLKSAINKDGYFKPIFIQDYIFFGLIKDQNSKTYSINVA